VHAVDQCVVADGPPVEEPCFIGHVARCMNIVLVAQALALGRHMDDGVIVAPDNRGREVRHQIRGVFHAHHVCADRGPHLDPIAHAGIGRHGQALPFRQILGNHLLVRHPVAGRDEDFLRANVLELAGDLVLHTNTHDGVVLVHDQAQGLGLKQELRAVVLGELHQRFEKLMVILHARRRDVEEVGVGCRIHLHPLHTEFLAPDVDTARAVFQHHLHQLGHGIPFAVRFLILLPQLGRSLGLNALLRLHLRPCDGQDATGQDRVTTP